MPNKTFEQLGITKADFINLAKSKVDINLVICGEKDRTNMKASLELKNKISNAKMIIIENASHDGLRIRAGRAKQNTSDWYLFVCCHALGIKCGIINKTIIS